MRYLALISALLISPAAAQNFQSMQMATELGSILGAERVCRLSFDQAAIERWIDQNVDASDMGFPSTLSLMIQGGEFQAQSMQGNALAAHCRSVERTARHFGFIP